jgi:hypothetical protein
MSEQQELIDALDDATDDRALLRGALTDALSQLSQARQEQRETERWLRRLEQSRSWKLTRPLRDASASYRWISQRLRRRAVRSV